ncbi:hypothetical protein AB7M47_007146 [Bradyrhizobium elkanii]
MRAASLVVSNAISTRIVGWVERSETHHLGVRMQLMGFASLYPSYGPAGLLSEAGTCYLKTNRSIYRQ